MTVETIYHDLHTKLHDVVPDVELRYKAELAFKINTLKRERNAVILGHNYMEPALFHSVILWNSAVSLRKPKGTSLSFAVSALWQRLQKSCHRKKPS